MNSSDIF